MAIPTYRELYPYVLRSYRDQQEHELWRVAEAVADELGLSPEQRAIKTSTGSPVIRNRVSWAHTYLKHAGLLSTTRRGVYRITERGLAALATGTKIDNDYLSQFDSFRDFKTRPGGDKLVEKAAEPEQADTTPVEQIDAAIRRADRFLADELLGCLRQTDPYYFEQIVTDLLNVMGYGEATTTQRTSDGGIDVIVNEDALGLSKIFAQAKRYGPDNKVNRKELQNFVGAMQLHNVNKGVFITTSSFNKTARSALQATQKSIVLIDGIELANLMIRYNLGVSVQQTYQLKRLDTDYFLIDEA